MKAIATAGLAAALVACPLPAAPAEPPPPGAAVLLGQKPRV